MKNRTFGIGEEAAYTVVTWLGIEAGIKTFFGFGEYNWRELAGYPQPRAGWKENPLVARARIRGEQSDVTGWEPAIQALTNYYYGRINGEAGDIPKGEIPFDGTWTWTNPHERYSTVTYTEGLGDRKWMSTVDRNCLERERERRPRENPNLYETVHQEAEDHEMVQPVIDAPQIILTPLDEQLMGVLSREEEPFENAAAFNEHKAAIKTLIPQVNVGVVMENGYTFFVGARCICYCFGS